MKKRHIWVLAIIIAAIIALLAIISLPETLASTTINEKVIHTLSTTTPLVFRPQDDLDRYLTALAKMECPHCTPLFRHLDSNGLYSYGCLQFQEATFLSISRRFGFSGDIYNCEDQKILARKMFEENVEGAAQNWYTSIYVRGLGLPSI